MLGSCRERIMWRVSEEIVYRGVTGDGSRAIEPANSRHLTLEEINISHTRGRKYGGKEIE